MPLVGIFISKLYGDNNLDDWEEIRDMKQKR